MKDRWEGGSVGRELIHRVSRSPPGGVSHGMGNSALVATTLVPTTKSTSVFLSEEIYLHARDFFVVAFQSVADRNKVLGDGHWSWEDKHILMMKLWHSDFNPESESFDWTPLWIRLPNLPMQYWFDACFEAVGNSLGTFLMADEGSLDLLHTTFACLLVVVDVTMGLPSEISITSSKGSWLQSVDYEGIPFRCREGHHTIQKANSQIQNLKLLENAQVDEWIEVKRKKGKKGLVGIDYIAPLLEGEGVLGEVDP
ncbi:hypothetical protein SUGI_0624820 [Cryptomeria japonica]|nr:hypothetical protein SUGI_0624820 [Cryptomeria japonica]